MTSIVTHAFEGADIRVHVDESGDPWFVASDVATALGYRDAFNATRGLADDERGTHNLSTPHGTQVFTVISEAGLYRLIMLSRVDGAERFRRWVTHEVLPSIRKTGGYGVAAFDPTDPRVIVAVLEAQVAKVKQLEATVAEQQETIAIATPKAEVHDRIMRSTGTFGFREAAKLVREATGATEGEFRALLFRRQWVQRLDRKMAPKHYGREAGYVSSRMKEWTDAEGITHVKPELRITPKGVSRAIAILLQDEAA